MSVTGLFDIARSGVMTSKMGLEVTGNNIANVNTPNYSRQDVVLEVANPQTASYGPSGRGVNVKDVRRAFDAFTVKQMLTENQNYGAASTLQDGLSRAEEIFNEQNGNGLSTDLTAYFQAWQEVSANPEDATQRNLVMTNAASFLAKARDMEKGLTDIQGNINQQLSAAFDQINGMANDISQLNTQISLIENGGTQTANDLRDKRDNILNGLSKLVKFDTLEDSSGRLTVTVGNRNLVSGSTVHQLSSRQEADGAVSVSLDNINITDKIGGGTVGGFVQLKNSSDSGIPAILNRLRKLTASVINGTNIQQSSGFGLNSKQSDFTVTDKTPQAVTAGSISSANITDFTNFVPGDYKFVFTDPNTYDVYKNGQALSAGNNFNGSSISLNGMQIDFGAPPSGGDSFNVAANGNNFFDPLTVKATELNSAGTTQISSANIFDRSAITYDEYKVTFTGANTYDLYNYSTKQTTSGTLTAANTLVTNGIEAAFNGVPSTGDTFKISPIQTAVFDSNVAIIDTRKVAAASASPGLSGDNGNALTIANMAQTPQAGLNGASFLDYYNGTVTTVGGLSKTAKDTATFADSLSQQLQSKHDSISGVSLDEEAMNLVKYQKAFEASARLINVTDDMLAILLKLGT
jgi:flagellar hook-associated protein 1 FlgK